MKINKNTLIFNSQLDSLESSVDLTGIEFEIIEEIKCIFNNIKR